MMTTQRAVKIKSGVKAGFNPQPDPPCVVNIGAVVNVVRPISR